MDFKFGVRAHDINCCEPEKLFSEVHRLGFDYVQLVFKKALVGSCYDKSYVSRVKESLKANAIKVAMLGSYFNPVHSDLSVVEKGIQEFKCNLDIASELNVDIVGSETGSYNDSPWTYVPKNHTEEGFKQSLNVFEVLKEHALKRGSCLCIEPAYAHIIYDVECLNSFVHALDSQNVYVTIDLFNLIYAGNHTEHKKIFHRALTTFNDRIKIVHLKDYIFEGERIVQVPPGKGNFDYKFMLKEVKEYCPEAVLIFEGVREPDLSVSLQYLKNLSKNI